MNPPTTIEQLALLLKEHRPAYALTGAGISTPSGIPDFRSPGGFWSKVDPMEMASVYALTGNTEQFYEFWAPTFGDFDRREPNATHYLLAALENAGYLGGVITQNIDGLHQKAGSKHVIEVHGSINTMSCIGCYKTHQAELFIHTYLEDMEIPVCPECDCILKPNVVLFEEQLPIGPWLEARNAIDACDLLIVAGSSLTVTPVANLPLLAIDNNARLVIVNKSPTYIDESCDVVIPGDVADILPEIAFQVLNTPL